MIRLAAVAFAVALTGCGGPTVKCDRYEVIKEYLFVGFSFVEQPRAVCVDYVVEDPK